MEQGNTRTFKQGTSGAQSPRNFDKRFNGTIPEASSLNLSLFDVNRLEKFI